MNRKKIEKMLEKAMQITKVIFNLTLLLLAKSIQIAKVIFSLTVLFLIFIYNKALPLGIKLYSFLKDLVIKFLNSRFYKKNRKMLLLFIKRKRKKFFILYKKEKRSFLKFYKQRKKVFLRFCYQKKIFHSKKFWLNATAGALILIFVFTNVLRSPYANAATYTFSQTSWSGGASASSALHPGDQSSWDKYESKDDNLLIVDNGSSLQLATTSSALIQTDDGTTNTGFNLDGSVFTNTEISGSADGASVGLSKTEAIYGTTDTYTVGANPEGVAFDSSTNSIWIANRSSNNVTKLDASDGSLIGTYTVGTNPQAMTFDSSSNSIWVANYGSKNVTKLDASDGSLIGTYTVGSAPADITFDTSTNSIWVANRDSNNVTKLDASDGSLIGTYTVGTRPEGIIFDPLTDSIWVANRSSNNVTKLDASDGSLIGTYTAGTFPQAVTFDPLTDSIWVANYGSNNVTKLNASDGSLIGTYAVSILPRGITFDSLTNSIWVTSIAYNNITKLNANDGSLIGNYTVGSAPADITFDTSTNSIWVANRDSNNVTKLEATASLITTHSVGSNPAAITLDPSSNSIWVANRSSNNVTKLNASDGSVIGTYTVGTNPQAMTFDSSSNSIWVANYGSGNVTKLDASDGSVIGTYHSNGTPADITFDPSTNSIWVTNYFSSQVTKLDASDGSVIDSYTVGTSPKGIIFDPSTNSIWATNKSSNNVTKLNASDGSLIGTYTVGTAPEGIIFDSSTNSIWVANRNSNNVTKLNASDGSLIGTHNLGFIPLAIAFDVFTNSIWITSSSAVTKFKATDNSIISTNYVRSSANAMIFDISTNSIWVANSSFQSVTKLNLGSSNYLNSPGTYVSGIIDLGLKPTLFSTLSYTSAIPANTNMVVDIRAGDSASFDDTWTDYIEGVATGGDISALGSHRYVQYRITLTTSDSLVTPALNDITIGYDSYALNQSLTSSSYDTVDTENIIGAVGWTENVSLPPGSGVTMSIRTASSQAGLSSSPFYDFTNTTSHCEKVDDAVTCPVSAIPADLKSGGDDQWWQYKITLTSDGSTTPTLDGVEVKYIVNANPELQNVTATQGEDGLVNISYDVRDSDTLMGSNTPGEITPSFEYWNGASWITCTTLSAGATDNKEVEASEFTTYTLTWNPKIDFNDNYFTDSKIRVKVNDNEGANNLDTLESNTFILDTADPVVTTFSLDARTDVENNISIAVSDDTPTNLKMKISNRSDLTADGLNANSGLWVDYASTTAWTFSGDASSVYYQVKDAYGNISNNGVPSTAVLPTRPPNILYQDVSNVETEEWREFIAWGRAPEPSSGFKQYIIYRSTDGNNFSVLSTKTDRNVNFLIDDNLDTNTTYYYRVITEDNAGNVSFYSDVISDRPDGQGGTDLTPPVISNITISEVSAQSALITWETDEPSNSVVSYITDDSGDFTDAPGVIVNSMTDNVGRLGKHSVFLNNLSPDTVYYIQVSSADPNGNVAVGGSGLSITTLAGPVISNVQASNVQNSTATITWETSDYANSRVFYSTSTAMTNSSEVAISESTISHSVNLTELSNGVRYYFYVQSGLTEDRNIIDGELIYYNFLTTSDVIAPQINFDPDTDIFDRQENSIRISWTTDEPAISTIEYSIDDSYDSLVTNTNYNTNHYFSLSDLEKGATYNFRLKSTDANNNLRTISDLSFTTADYSDITEPIISEVLAKQVADVSALITWKTDEPADSTVEYGNISDDYDKIATSSALNYSHSVLLEDLDIQTTYYFRALSSDANNNSTSSAEYSFTTQDALVAGATSTTIVIKEGGGVLVIDKNDQTKPIISNLQALNIGLDKATISWTTDEPANSVVEFGLSEEYGQASVSLEMNSSHSQTLSNLSPNTAYYYRVSSSDASGNISDFAAGNFITLSLDDIDDLDNLLDFDDLDSETEEADEDFESILSPEEQAKNDDNFMNILRRTFAFIKQASKSVSSSILESSLMEQQEAIKELADMTEPPTITSGPIINVWEDMAVITWETDKKTGSLVAVTEEGVPFSNYDLVQNFGNPEVYANDHQVVISGLKPATSYNYQLRGNTQIGSRVISNPETFTTLAKPAKIENYVIDRLSNESASFKWTSSLPTNSLVKVTPYRNGTLSIDEAVAVSSESMTTIHEITVDNLEPGVFYRVDLSGRDSTRQILSQTIESFSTSDEEMPFIIEQVKTSSALAGAEGLRVQSIISWNTSKLATSKVYYRKGMNQDDSDWPFETILNPAYSRRHLVVITDFLPGEVYQFQVESEASNGQKIRSHTYTILTPRQRESVFQVILNNIEQTFGWVGAFNK